MIPFVGPSYQLKTKRQAVQRSINLMPTPIESGSGKAAVYLQPVPGLVQFSPGGGGGGDGDGTVEVFMADFPSHSCNYGFFARPGGGFLLVTDTFGSDRDGSFSSPEGWYLKLQRVNPDGSLGTAVVSNVYVTNGIMETVLYNGFIYAGFVTEIATSNRIVIVKINPDTLAVTEAYKYTGTAGIQYPRVFDLIAAPDKVMFNTWQVDSGGFGGFGSSVFIVVDLDTGAEDQTVTLPFNSGLDFKVGHVSQEVVGGPWFTAGTEQVVYALRRCNLTTGAIIDTYSVTDFFGSSAYKMHTVKRAGSALLVFCSKNGDYERYMLGVFNTTTNTLGGVVEVVGKPHELDFPLYDPVRNIVFFVTTEETVNDATYGSPPPFPVVGQARVYGYSLDTLTIEYDQQLPLDFAPGVPITAGTAPFTGFVGADGYIYVSHYTGPLVSGGFTNELYKIFRLDPP